ncbi:hypothetical protein KIMH_15160 [Bombiscardovia apis]|uniref:Glycosyltransferase 2-like domain-containing protein n=1 Tax=Bombiscardovia apis TaxID=2932182 RepID=A0ABN6SL35_9BIFI|nr:glycosyltransferase family 2 protein [Bombiscardovia apis]BDR55405.1 hypothetical protein KIMH_15160 [Bombiscardovia apis]
MNKIAFVVLHFFTYDDTVDCVESILSLKNAKSCEIIVVDNGSTNGSGKLLHTKYKTVSNVHVLLNEQNLGFARGNNVGYTFAKEKLNADIVVTVNNDIVIEQKDFIPKLQAVMETVDVCGPDIISEKTGKHSNPQHFEGISKKKLKQVIVKHELVKFAYIVCNFKGFDTIYQRFIDKITPDKTESEYNRDYENVVLHGAFIVFGPRFVEQEQVAFDPRTFLYMEEDLLFIRCQRKGYTIRYTPSLQVIHDEHSSVNYVQADARRRMISYLTNQIRSEKIVLTEL